MTNALTNFNDRIEETIKDLEGQDEMFFHDASLRTIVWWIGRVKTIATASAGIKGAERRKFIQAVAEGYRKMPERRIYEALSVYQKFAKPSDSLMETSERIFSDAGTWSKALALTSGKKDEEAVESSEHTCTFICPKCGNQLHQ